MCGFAVCAVLFFERTRCINVGELNPLNVCVRDVFFHEDCCVHRLGIEMHNRGQITSLVVGLL